MGISLLRVARFARRAWPWLFTLPFFVLAGMLLHGAFELATIAAQGGRIVHPIVFNQGRLWWLIDFDVAVPPGWDPLPTYVAPFAVWIWITTAAALGLSRLRPSATSRALFIGGQLLPMAAISTALAIGVSLPSQMGLLSVVNDRPLWPVLVAGASLPLFAAIAWPNFRRIWGGLSAPEFTLGYTLLLAAPWALVFAQRAWFRG